MTEDCEIQINNDRKNEDRTHADTTRTCQDHPVCSLSHSVIPHFAKLHGHTVLSDLSVAKRMSKLLAWPPAEHYVINLDKK
jgi:hypothetical protein